MPEDPKAGRRRSLVARIALAAVVLIVIALWVRLPLGTAHPVAQLVAPSSPQPRSQTRDVPFSFDHFQPNLTIATVADAQSARVQMDLLDGSGERLCGWPLGEGKHQSTFSVGKGFPAGQYSLHFVESGVSGAYSVHVYGDKEPLSLVGKFFLLALIVMAIAGPLYAYARLSARRGHPRPALQWSGLLLGYACFLVVILALPTLLHEGGHAIAQAGFGGWDPARSNLLGLWGEPRSVGRTYDLPPWQQSIVSIAGPALPTLVAYLSFVLWVSAPGRRARSRRPVLDAFWSGVTFVLLWGQLGLLLPMAGLLTDTDYSRFVLPFGSLKPLADALLVVLALINGALIYVFGRHLLRLRAKSIARLSSERSTEPG